VLVVGGWYDAEDLFGSLKTYEAIEKNTKQNSNKLVMGPWTHGGWARSTWSQFGSMNFGSNTSDYFQKIEYEFFSWHLKGTGSFKAAEATVFETGTNQWKEYSAWPPKHAKPATLYLQNNNKLSFTKPNSTNGADEYVSDPANPVPYMDTKSARRDNGYMVADQRFAYERKDVLGYESDVLEKDITLSGPITVQLFASTTGTDADFVVKVIDVLPDHQVDADGKNIGGMQMLVRAEVLRGKFRNSFSKPEPFTPNTVTEVKYELNDVAHCFKKGHRIMVQVQSSWFPLVDRNPQKFMRIPHANKSDFQKATIKIHHDQKYPSLVKVLVVE
jgi:putative CocE/NonD family hydrolase